MSYLLGNPNDPAMYRRLSEPLVPDAPHGAAKRTMHARQQSPKTRTSRAKANAGSV